MTETGVYLLVLGGLVATFLWGYALGAFMERRWWRWEMVERRHAMYYYYDGKWYWNEDVPKAKDPIANNVRKMGL